MSSDHELVLAHTPLAVLCVTKGGFEKAMCLSAVRPITILCTQALLDRLSKFQVSTLSQANVRVLGFKTFNEMCTYAFSNHESQLWIMALGIVVRSIAPFILDKYKDPAIVVMDEKAAYVISVLSGHIGGANGLTEEIARQLGATPVITTATDINGLGAFEMYLKAIGVDPQPHRAVSKWINLRLVERSLTTLYLDDFESLDEPKPVGMDIFMLKDLEGKVIPSALKVPGVYIGIRALNLAVEQQIKEIILKRLVIGIGFRRGKSTEELEAAVLLALSDYGYARDSIACFATIEKKAIEIGLTQLATKWHVPIQVVSLACVETFSERCSTSDFVQAAVGVGAVAEPCALAIAGDLLLHKKASYGGITLAFGYLSSGRLTR